MTTSSFIKWPGSKRRLLPTLRSRFPPNFHAYVEPFVGGGSLFFDSSPRTALLADANERLIRTYTALRDEPNELIERLAQYENDPVLFQRARERSAQIDGESDVEVGAWLIFLLKTSFNGLYRVNRDNGFNTPYGDYKNPKICDRNALRACSAALQGVSLQHASFETILAQADADDFCYIDPPYLPKSATSRFVDYTPCGFSYADHVRLRNVAVDLSRRGVYFLASNSAVPATYQIWDGHGFHIEQVTTTRSIAASTGSRGVVQEVVISNFVPGSAQTMPGPAVASSRPARARAGRWEASGLSVLGIRTTDQPCAELACALALASVPSAYECEPRIPPAGKMATTSLPEQNRESRTPRPCRAAAPVR